MATRVAMLDDYQGVALEMADWGSLGADIEVQAFRDHLVDEAAIADRLADFDMVVAMRERTPFRRSLLERLPKLRLLVTTGARNASIDVRAANELGVVVCGTGGTVYPTAELTIGLMLSVLRRIPQEDAAIRGGRWQQSVGVGLRGKTVGIIGLGNQGALVAEMLRGFRLELLAWSENMTPERASEHGATYVSKDELLQRSHIVTIHLVLSDRTRGLIGERELALMKPTAYLVNTSRGPIVDEAALARALHAGSIAGAGIDVFEDEPLPAGHPLRSAPNTVLTPHIGYVTRETYELFYRDALEDVRAFLAGGPVRVIEAR